MSKLKAIWNLLRSEHYLLLTASGSLNACYPKNYETINLIKEIGERLESKKYSSKEATQ